MRDASRYVWHDELYTYYIANEPSWPQFWTALRLDLNPPLSYLVVRGSLRIFGDNPYALRLPSIVAFLVGSLALFRFISLRAGRDFGLLGMLALWTTPYLILASEARPYAMVFGFLGLALLSWQQTLTDRPAGWSTPILFLSLVALMFSHLFGVFYAAPFLAAETYMWWNRRTVRIRVWLALLIPYIIPLVYISKAKSYEAGSIPQAFQASFHRIISFYAESLSGQSTALLVAAGVGISLALIGSRVVEAAPLQFSRAELLLAVVLLTLPVYQMVVLMRSHAGFFSRYALPVVIAYAILFVAFMAKIGSGRPAVALLASCILALFVFQSKLLDGVVDLRYKRNPLVVSHQPFDPCVDVKPDIPLVAASGLTFVEMDHYASVATTSRLYYLTDRQSALKYSGATIFEGLPVAKQHFPIRSTVQPYSDFMALHDHFLVIGSIGYPEDWLIKRLLDSGAHLEFIGVYPNSYKDWQVFEVTLNGRQSSSASMRRIQAAETRLAVSQPHISDSVVGLHLRTAPR